MTFKIPSLASFMGGKKKGTYLERARGLIRIVASHHADLPEPRKEGTEARVGAGELVAFRVGLIDLGEPTRTKLLSWLA